MFLALFFSSLFEAQAVPLQMTQQGRILDNNGQALEGSQFVVFRIYDQETAGTLLWDEVIGVQFTNGYYAAVLGADETSNPLDSTTLSSYPLFLEIQINSASPMSPRQAIQSAPYAQIAGVAESVDGGKVNASDIDIGHVPVIDANRYWVGQPIDWSQLQSVPPDLLDGDDNTQLSETDVENYITNGGISLHVDTTLNGQKILTEGMESDTLADLSCINGEIPKYDDILLQWYCDSDADTLGGLSCGTDEVAKWNGVQWACQSDNDTLSGLSCNTSQIAKWDGNAWICANPSGGAEYMTSSQRDAISSPTQQQMIFNTDTNCFQVYDSGVWLNNCFECVPPSQPSNITVTNTNTICPNNTGEAFSIASVTGATSYTWTVPSDATIVSGQGTESIVVDFGEADGTVCVTADVACGSSTERCKEITFPTGTETFSYGSSAQQFIVPECVTSIHAEVYGASGAGVGGLGGYAEADIPVTPGDILYVYTGQAGNGCSFCDGTFNGGGGRKHDSYSGYQGGGGTDIRTINGAWDDSAGLSSRILVAGGGAGGGYVNSIGGGAGGGLEGQDGDSGKGGTQTAGGDIAQGSWCTQNGNYVRAGGFGYGGMGQGANAGGGGGGGGWYGGGGGCYNGGGGGSSYSASTNSNFNTVSGTHSGNGKATITW